MASDRTSQTGEATAGFVQRPTIPPRSRRVISHSPLEIAAEYRAIVIYAYPAIQLRSYSAIQIATSISPAKPFSR